MVCFFFWSLGERGGKWRVFEMEIEQKGEAETIGMGRNIVLEFVYIMCLILFVT